MVRTRFIYLILLALKAFARLFYKHDAAWVSRAGDGDPWEELQLVAVLNHTSLFEWLYFGSVPNRFLRRLASAAVVPVADTTFSRPLVGRFLRLIVAFPVPITRKADSTWQSVLEHIGSDKMIIIFPEGRMKRAGGLDKHGRPMTARGGIADILRRHEGGSMLIAYSGGMHQVQAPGQRLPRLFKTIRIRFESLDIGAYRQDIGTDLKPVGFKRAVRRDLDRRRDLHCLPLEARLGRRP
jgi:1-acyl-sn-glycerol-3-phosphate acyltransferase